MSAFKILVVLGTRPEAIKLAPVIRRLRREPGFRIRICATSQHRDMLAAMLRTFGLRPDHDLDIMRPGQRPDQVLRRVMAGLDPVLAREKPELVLVQGDTTTALAAALAAFHNGIPVGHVEAGLRTGDIRNPFPEEANRIIIDHISDLLFAPTSAAVRNLRRAGAPSRKIALTGNTAVDALLWAAGRPHRFTAAGLRRLPDRDIVVVTLHRRENFGPPLQGMLRAIRDAAQRLPRLYWVYPVHPNPKVQGPARRLLRHPRILLTPPLGYLDFVHLMKRARFIVTDSGGIQEEAPSLGKPVIVVRKKTERPELIGRGGILTGTSRPALLRAILACERKARLPLRGRNPFGDGRAAQRIARTLRSWSRGRARRS